MEWLNKGWDLARSYWPFGALAVGVIGWIYGLYQRNRRRQTENRAQGPYLVARSCTAHSAADGVRSIDIIDHPEMLPVFAAEAGSQPVEVHLGFENRGNRVLTTSIVGDQFSLVGTDGQIVVGANRGWIRYVCNPSLVGQRERFKLSFQTLEGVKLIHVYETLHGMPALRRVKPA